MRLAGAVLFFTSAALADPAVSVSSEVAADSSFTFEWQAQADCPTRSEVLTRAERLVGHGLSRASGPPIVLWATVESESSSSWQLRVSSGSGSGSGSARVRQVSASSCDELGDAMALLIALSIDPEHAALRPSHSVPPLSQSASPPEAAFSDIPREPAPSTLPPPPSIAPRALQPARGRPALESPRPEQELHGAVSGFGAVWLGRLPGVAPGLVLRGALSRRPLVVALELGFFPMQHVAAHGVFGDLWLGTLGGAVGYTLFDGALTPSVGLELDLLRGVGGGVSAPGSGGVWLLGLDTGMLFRYPVRSSVSLLAAGRLSVLLEQARFLIEPDVTLFRPSRVGAQLGLGVELTIR